MKILEKKRARCLRKKGRSVRAIAAMLNVSRGSVSRWVSDISLSDIQVERLNKKHCAINGIKARERAQERYRAYRSEADTEWQLLKDNPIFLIGASLYAGEGSKTSRDTISVCNSDPRIMIKMLQFFRLIGIPEQKIKFSIYIHKDCHRKNCFSFWSHLLGVQEARFYRAVLSVPKSSKLKRRRMLPYGTFRITISCVRSAQKLYRWLELLLGAHPQLPT